ncbi:hypothetical protein [Bacillus mycoides]|uniref:hypothetical protein n=1 Tax=Bacillus mycoides TaxID=1405 RepID=UPI002E1A21D9|nr:hypothetical protein [Bacillus mycoides]
MTKKHLRFQRVFKRRFPKFMKQFDLICNMSHSRYSCTEEEVKQFISEIEEKFKYCKGLYNKRLELDAKK